MNIVFVERVTALNKWNHQHSYVPVNVFWHQFNQIFWNKSWFWVFLAFRWFTLLLIVSVAFGICSLGILIWYVAVLWNHALRLIEKMPNWILLWLLLLLSLLYVKHRPSIDGDSRYTFYLYETLKCGILNGS